MTERPSKIHSWLSFGMPSLSQVSEVIGHKVRGTFFPGFQGGRRVVGLAAREKFGELLGLGNANSKKKRLRA